MNYALVLMLNNNFFIAFKAFITSLLESNKWFIEENIPIIILDDNCSEEIRQNCKKFYNNIIFQKIRYENYQEIEDLKIKKQIQFLFYKIDLFSIVEYDRLVFIDLDIIISKEIKKLFTIYTEPFYEGDFFNLENKINSKIYIINKLDRLGTYYRLLNFIKIEKENISNQQIFSSYFKEETYKIKWEN